MSMKRVISIMAMVATMAVVGTSCLSRGSDYEPRNTAVVSIIDGDAMTGKYAIFDDNTKAYIANQTDFAVSSSAYYKGEARALIAYADLATEPIMGYDCAINVVQLVELKTKSLKTDDIDDEFINKYTAAVELPYYQGGVTYARNKYVNLQFIFRCGGQSMADKHDFQLVYNPEHKGAFALAYPTTDDGYLYLELHHNMGGDTSAFAEAETVCCFYMDDETIGKDIMNDYFGLKILYRDFKSGDIAVAEYKFGK